MSSHRVLACFAAVTLLAGCCDRSHFHNRYQLIAATDGRVLRLDTADGDVFLVEKDALIRIPEYPDSALSVGHIYKFEDGRWMKYTGNGKFEDMKTIDYSDMMKDLQKKK